MRILSISGQNIASLSDHFEINFNAAPLKGAGLFAITGETGAGKSSILDAMCLALYGDAPRLATGTSSDEVPDPSGDAIKAKDTRAILRRGAVQGWAEVRFTAQDGNDYIARWQARRARDKADGKLQNVARSMARASDQQILASQTTAVTEHITSLTGLTYEEFRRTVLLAQGDFDAFLRADTNERAGLLEKATGTGLYRSVSTRVYERTEAARQAHDALALRRGEHRLLSDEEHAVLAEENASLVAENAAAMAERSKLQADLERHVRYADAARQFGLAEAAEAGALAEIAAATSDRERLALIDRAEPLRALWNKDKDATVRVATATTGLETKRDARSRGEAVAEELRKAAARETVITASANAERLRGLARQAAQSHRATAERHASAVNPLLLPLEESDKALDDPELIERLEILVRRVTNARQSRKTAQDLLAELAPKVSGQASKSEAAAQLADRARQQADARQLVLEAQRPKRARLLGGEPTSAHRTRFNDGRKAALSARDDAQKTYTEASKKAVAAVTEHQLVEAELSAAEAAATAAQAEFVQKRSELGLPTEDLETLFALGEDEVQALRDHLRELDDTLIAARAALNQRRQDLLGLQQDRPQTPADDLRTGIEAVDAAIVLRQQRQGAIENQIAEDAENRQKLAGLEAEICKARAELDVWQAVKAAIGSRNGDRFARFAQSITLDILADNANRHLADLNPRYRLRRAADLALQVEDIDMGGEARATRSLSGGERFLVSLALALALSRMGGKGGLAATLFIDQGFGSLDAASLDLAIEALEGLQSQGRQVGVISHVEAMKDRIPVRKVVTQKGGGKSAVRIAADGTA